MELHDVWFILIAVLWIGYFFLEGFDFGIGILTKLLARGTAERRVLINTIGPVWDGNEVWLLIGRMAPPSRPSRTGTRRCSAASTSRCW